MRGLLLGIARVPLVREIAGARTGLKIVRVGCDCVRGIGICDCVRAIERGGVSYVLDDALEDPDLDDAEVDAGEPKPGDSSKLAKPIREPRFQYAPPPHRFGSAGPCARLSLLH